MIEAPIFHVNAEDPEAVVAVSRLAIEFRQQFRKDVFIDLVCYRKYGHNEQDEQTFTQPVLAGLIKNQPSTLTSYAARLRDAGVITEDDLRAVMNRIDEQLDKAQQSAKAKPNTPTIDPGGKRWSGLVGEYSFKNADTGVSKERLAEVAAALGRTPEGMNVNPKLKPLLKARAEIPTSPGLVVGHADAEILAIGTLLLDGIPVRLSGQDCRRGTFSQRHAVLRDFATGEPYNSLNQMREMGVPGVKELEPGTKASDGRARQAKFCVYDSPLSEEGVLGFDYGYSLADPNMLVMWEGQFGDFFNGAQVVVDQYLASSEIKWHRWSGLVMLLPHGYEGAGPEHSSARLERFLELCADENMEVVMPSTGAQMFHLLRRVVARNFRKPLIVMTPKSMLRTPTSSAAELLTGTRFQEIIDDAGIERKGVKRVVLCSGKLYHELAERRALLENKDVALVRVEQFYPLHTDLLKRILAGYGKGVEVVWCQEEPRNAGAWRHMALSVRETLGVDLVYIGREASASPAVGSKTKHKYEQEAILAAAVGAKPKKDEGTKNGQAGTGSGASRVSGKPGVKA
jgi:2-oxoglutarate dehydrogenase E1 component